MNRAGLTACLIVKDESLQLEGCLQALSDVDAIDEICVLDTGSTDDSVAIARRAGARVARADWRDDFAAARNQAVAMARTDWVLSIDADERVVCDSDRLARVVQTARRQRRDALVLEVHDVRANGIVVGCAQIMRLLRVSTTHFANRVHEVVTRRDGGEPRIEFVDPGTISIRHHGYGDEAANARRNARNARIADLELVERRTRVGDVDGLVLALINHGRALASAGVLADGAADWLEAWRQGQGGSDTRLRCWAGELAVGALAEVGRVAEARDIVSALARRGTDEALLAWLTGLVLQASGRRPEALICFRRSETRTSAMGERMSDATVLHRRLRLELDLGLAEDARRDAARLVANYSCFDWPLDAYLALAEGDATGAARELLGLIAAPGVVEALRTALGERAAVSAKDTAAAGVVLSEALAAQANAPRPETNSRPAEESASKFSRPPPP